MRECSRRKKTEGFLQGLPFRSIDRLLHDWELWARDDQLAPEGDWTSWLVLGGRGAGKTRAGAEWVRAQALAPRGTGEASAPRIALVGETLGDVRSVMIEGVSGLLAVHAGHERPHFEPSKRQLTWPGGAVAQMFSAEDPESMRGPQFSHIWLDGPASRDISHSSYQDQVKGFTGRGLKPLSPVHLRARAVGNDFEISWKRRTRTGGDSWEISEVPLGEDAEAYEVDILDGPSVKRTLATSVPKAIYSEADQIADFGLAQASYTVRVHQLSSVFGRGTARERTLNV